MHNKRSAGRTYKIPDRGRLAAVLDRTIRTRFTGSASAAARSVGLTQSQLSRLLRGQLGGVRRETLLRLVELVPPAQRAEVKAALLPREAATALRHYERWLRESGPAVL